MKISTKNGEKKKKDKTDQFKKYSQDTMEKLVRAIDSYFPLNKQKTKLYKRQKIYIIVAEDFQVEIAKKSKRREIWVTCKNRNQMGKIGRLIQGMLKEIEEPDEEIEEDIEEARKLQS